MIYVIDDDRDFAECVAQMIRKIARSEVAIFGNGVEAIAAMDEKMPELIFLDVLLDGPDGFTFLNEIMSYSDTEKIPIVIISSLAIKQGGLENYGVVAVLNKAEMTPSDVRAILQSYVK